MANDALQFPSLQSAFVYRDPQNDPKNSPSSSMSPSSSSSGDSALFSPNQDEGTPYTPHTHAEPIGYPEIPKLDNLSELLSQLTSLQSEASTGLDKVVEFEVDEVGWGGRETIKAAIKAYLGVNCEVKVQWNSKDWIIVRLGESQVHAGTAWRFSKILENELETLLGDEYCGELSATITDESTGLEKSPDASWNTPDRVKNGKSSLVLLEVAVTQSWPEVKKKADVYLRKGSSVLMVIIININLRPTSFQVNISSWTKQGRNIVKTSYANSSLVYDSRSADQIITSLTFPLSPFTNKRFTPNGNPTYIHIPLNKVELLIRSISNAAEGLSK